MKFFSKRIWRAITGILLGGMFTAFLAWIIGLSQETPSAFPFAKKIGHYVAAPPIGLLSAADDLIPFGWERAIVLVPFVVLLFYPIVFGLLFFLAGEKQTKLIIAEEVMILMLIIGLGYIGTGVFWASVK